MTYRPGRREAGALNLNGSTIKAIRVFAFLDSSFISIEPQFNYDDLFGHDWAKDEDTGMMILQPGVDPMEDPP
jgi:hypothetical protein